LSFRSYYRLFFRQFWEDAKPWARDNILWGIAVVAVPPIAVFFRHHGKYVFDWELLRITVYLYALVLAVYILIHSLRTPWKLHNHHVKLQLERESALLADVEKEKGEHLADKAQFQVALADEIADRKRPEVVVICDWKRGDNAPIERDARALILKTLTDVAALDVKVQDIEQENGTARFNLVSLLAGKSELRPYCSIERENTSYALWDLFSLVKHSCESSGEKMSEREIPIIVDYRDTHGTWHQSLNILRYDWFLGKGEVYNTGFRRKT
jgi:hypothetical protein